MLTAVVHPSSQVAAAALAENIVETLRVPVLVLDAEFRVQLANRAFYDTFRASPVETLGCLVHELGDGQWDIPRLRDALEQIVARNAQVEDFEVEHLFPTIGRGTMLLGARGLVGPANEELILLTIENVTERRALDRSRREFMEVVGHELRSPLTAIIAYAQLMQRLGTYDEKAAVTIMAQARQMDRLIGDFLDDSRLAAGRLELQPARLDLVALARAAAQQAQLLTSRHRLRVESPDGPLEGWWDRGRLEQVLANLLGNATKYSPDGGDILLRIEDLGASVRVSVEDNGVGIMPAAIPRLFDRSYRAPEATDEAPGLGLGLYVAGALVAAHGGQFQVESLLGRGSVFSFTLPRGAHASGIVVGDAHVE